MPCSICEDSGPRLLPYPPFCNQNPQASLVRDYMSFVLHLLQRSAGASQQLFCSLMPVLWGHCCSASSHGAHSSMFCSHRGHSVQRTPKDILGRTLTRARKQSGLERCHLGNSVESVHIILTTWALDGHQTWVTCRGTGPRAPSGDPQAFPLLPLLPPTPHPPKLPGGLCSRHRLVLTTLDTCPGRN